jgi:hypothetical protein
MRIIPHCHLPVCLAALACSLFALLPSFGQASQSAQVTGRFVGNWVEDQSQRKSGAQPTLTFRNGADGMEELRGFSARPLVEAVRFGAGPYAFGEPNATMEWKQQGGGRFERTMLENGKILELREITVSQDGQTLTEITERDVPDGKKTTTTIVYARTSGSGQGLEGVWKPQTVRSDTPLTMSIQPVGAGLDVSTRTGTKFLLTFDGKGSAITGPGVISGATITGKILSNDVVQTTDARLGTTTSTENWTLSADGKTLTRTITPLGPNASKEPTIIVYVKQ